MSHEQLLAACKFALACIEGSARIAELDHMEIPGKSMLAVAVDRLQKVIELDTKEPIDIDALLQWAREECIREAMEE